MRPGENRVRRSILKVDFLYLEGPWFESRCSYFTIYFLGSILVAVLCSFRPKTGDGRGKCFDWLPAKAFTVAQSSFGDLEWLANGCGAILTTLAPGAPGHSGSPAVDWGKVPSEP